MSFLSRLFGKKDDSAELLCPHCERSMDAGHDIEACARKGMSRRFFFGMVGAVAAVAALPKVPALPKATTAEARGVGIRIIKKYDRVNDLFVSRMDVLYGFSALSPELACKIIG